MGNFILNRLIGDSLFKVVWTGTTTDVNYYDVSKPDTRVEINGEFVLSIK